MGSSPESPMSKFTVVGLRDCLAHHTLQLQVYIYKVCQQSCRCLKDEKQNCKLPALLPGTVPILYGNLLTLMTIITKLGVFYVDHMNDDVPEVNSLPEPGTKASCKGCVLHVHADKKHNHTSKNFGVLSWDQLMKSTPVRSTPVRSTPCKINSRKINSL